MDVGGGSVEAGLLIITNSSGGGQLQGSTIDGRALRTVR